MNKAELITAMAAKADLTKDQTTAALATLLSTITETLTAGDKVAIPNLGTFEVKQHAARTGHNPRTGETVEIAAKKVPAFKPAKALKEAVE
ncbi:MAG: HU family DNA-binding protein [Lachnospiraceae bacterium]|nr:HU family DNA-binding protein [Lachnospiraceae bacterium]